MGVKGMRGVWREGDGCEWREMGVERRRRV